MNGKWKCYIFGHHWIHLQKIKEDVEIDRAAKIYTEREFNIWRCVHCGNAVKVKPNKRPKNKRRDRFELLDNFFNVFIK